MQKSDIVEKVFQKHKDNFDGSFHTTLWEILFNGARDVSKKESAFTPIIDNGFTRLGIADKDKRGYTPTPAVFKTHNYKEAQEICNDLNNDIFSLDDKEASLIVLSSIRS